MDYHDAGTKTAVTASPGFVAKNTYNSNSIFDPDQTGTGHQPRYHDQWATFYRKYYVRKCTVTLRIHSTTATADSGGYLFTERLAANDTPKVDSTYTLINLLERAKSSNGKVRMRRFPAMGGGQSNWMVVKQVTIPAFDVEGRDKADMTGVFGANPSRLTNFNVMWVFPQRSANLSFFYEVDLKYEVILMDPIMPSAS